ncbi:hypothetical protein GGR50DRAFT_418838 [Xylaria sp. CBS 124048]|nr:hypothetical protein GGR50DRAFT_418838 [Xylaria sp. CBS 124048]
MNMMMEAEGPIFTIRSYHYSSAAQVAAFAETIDPNNLRHLRVIGLPISWARPIITQVGLISLSLEGCDWDVQDLEEVDKDQSVLRTIELLGCNIDDKGFEIIMDSFPMLRNLAFYRRVDDDESHFDLIGDALRRQGLMEKLIFRDDCLAPLGTPLGSLSGLTKLTDLEIDMDFLIDSPLYEGTSNWSLVDVLPASLVRLTLHVESEEVAELWFRRKVEELLRAARFAELEFVGAPRPFGDMLIEVAQRVADGPRPWLTDRVGGMIRLPGPRPIHTYNCVQAATLFKRVVRYLDESYAGAYQRAVRRVDPQYNPDDHDNCTPNMAPGFPSLAQGVHHHGVIGLGLPGPGPAVLQLLGLESDDDMLEA